MRENVRYVFKKQTASREEEKLLAVICFIVAVVGFALAAYACWQREDHGICNGVLDVIATFGIGFGLFGSWGLWRQSKKLRSM